MPPEDSTTNIETVQHPTLGPLRFPSDMPYEQRNQLIENLEAEQKAPARAGAETGNSQVLAGFTRGGQSTPKVQPGPQDSLQRYSLQPRMPAGTELQQDTKLPGNFRLPRFYGAPPDDSNAGSPPANVLEGPNPFGTNPSNVLDRIRPPQPVKESDMQRGKFEARPPDMYRSSLGDDSLAKGIGLAQPEMLVGVGNESLSATRIPTLAGKNLEYSTTSGPQPMGAAQSRSTKLAEAVGDAGMAAAEGHGMQKAITSGQPNSTPETPKPILKGKVGRTEAGADNQPEDVKAIQQLLNAAIDSGELTGKKLVEDGKVTPQMLAMIDEYQNRYIRGVQPDRPKRPGTPPEIRLIDDKSSTLKQLRQNPFADSRWNQYDDIIKNEVKNFNQKLPHSGLDWRLVKAMLWQESGGPDRGIEWTRWPMQIGRRKADTAIQDVISGRSNTNLIATDEDRKAIADAFRWNKMTPELNIKAGIIYLLGRKIASVKNVRDSPMDKEVIVKPGDTVSTLAKRLGTTKDQIYLDHRELAENPNALRPGKLPYSKAHLEPATWFDEWTALHKYNSELVNKHYADQVLKRYEAIKRKWPQ